MKSSPPRLAAGVVIVVAVRCTVQITPRKPRGCPASVVEDYSSRYSFTCGRCEKRATPASVRFLGRRVYLAVVLMLVSPLGGTQGSSAL